MYSTVEGDLEPLIFLLLPLSLDAELTHALLWLVHALMEIQTCAVRARQAVYQTELHPRPSSRHIIVKKSISINLVQGPFATVQAEPDPRTWRPVFLRRVYPFVTCESQSAQHSYMSDRILLALRPGTSIQTLVHLWDSP